jgi:hypothetical protein
MMYCLDSQAQGKISISQAVNRRLTVAAGRIGTQVASYYICGGHNGAEVGILRVFLVPLPILIPPSSHNFDSNSIVKQET